MEARPVTEEPTFIEPVAARWHIGGRWLYADEKGAWANDDENGERLWNVDPNYLVMRLAYANERAERWRRLVYVVLIAWIISIFLMVLK